MTSCLLYSFWQCIFHTSHTEHNMFWWSNDMFWRPPCSVMPFILSSISWSLDPSLCHLCVQILPPRIAPQSCHAGLGWHRLQYFRFVLLTGLTGPMCCSRCCRCCYSRRHTSNRQLYMVKIHCVSQELHVHQNCTNDSFLVENHQTRGILWPGRGSESVQTCREKNLKNMQNWTHVCRVLCSSFLLLALYCATQSKRLKIQSKPSFVRNSYQFITSSAHSAALASGFRPTGEVVVLVAVKGGQHLEGPTPEKSVSMSVSTLFVKEIQIEHVQK